MNANEKSLGRVNENLMDEAEKLIWAYLDELIEDDEAERLEEMLRENEQVRSRYQQCAEVHADLYENYRVGTRTESKSPVLGSLGDFLPTTADPTSVTD